MLAKYNKYRYKTNLAATMKYGENWNKKKTVDRLDVSLDATHKESGGTNRVNFTANVKLPAKVGEHRLCDV